MTTHAYSQLYLSKASRAIGNMLHDAVVEYGINGTDFLRRFIQSDVARQFENGHPKYIAGKSGLELFLLGWLDVDTLSMVVRPQLQEYSRYRAL